MNKKNLFFSNYTHTSTVPGYISRTGYGVDVASTLKTPSPELDIISILKKRIALYFKQFNFNRFVSDFVPLIIIKLFKLIRNRNVPVLGFSGIYSSFEDCWEKNRALLSKSGSFNNAAYAQFSLQKTRDVLAKPLWEIREDVRMVKFLTLVTLGLAQKGSLNILDYGGGIGYHYTKIHLYLKNANINYTIFDLPEVVAKGKEFFNKIKNVHFTDRMPSKKTKFDIILLSGVLHYIDDHQKLISDLAVNYEPDIIFLTRLPAGDTPDFVTMQTITEASFPAHWFNYTKLKEFFLSLNYYIEDSWEETESFELNENGTRYSIPHSKGMTLRRITP